MSTKKTTRQPVRGRAPKKAVQKAAFGPATSAPSVAMVVNMVPKSLSGEMNQDSEPHLTVNPENLLQMVGTAFTPSPSGGPNAPVYVSLDGGNTWFLNMIVPSKVGSGLGTGDITTSFSRTGGRLYAGILRDPTGNLEFLRTANFAGPAAMTVLASRPNADQPFTHATTVATGPDAGKDRVYIGENDFSPATPGQTQTLDQSLDGARTTPAFTAIRVEKRTTAGQDGPQCRPASHADGTAYAAFYGWRSQTGSFGAGTLVITGDVVVIRDDQGGVGATPFTNLVDTDGLAGKRVVQGVTFPFMRNGTPATGQQRIGGSISIAVDPRNSATVYLAWGDRQPGSFLTLHVRKSTDRGQTWSGADLLTIPNATNAAIAVNASGLVGLLCQEVTGTGADQRWVTRVKLGQDGTNWSDLVLATTPAATPVKTFDPYLGDYDHMLALGPDFYGIFSASNRPNSANFPNGVRYQRNANFPAQTLLDVDNTTPVDVSIDPFFFKIVTGAVPALVPCQVFEDRVSALTAEISSLEDALSRGEIPPPPRTPRKIAQVKALIARKKRDLIAAGRLLLQCRAAHP